MSALNAPQFSVKFPTREGVELTPEGVVPTFHRWIQNSSLDELLIDVTSYAHVQRGPGVLLIGHEAHYSFEETDGEAGLRYVRKRQAASNPRARLRETFRSALKACELLERDTTLSQPIIFDTASFEFAISNRLLAPNADETLDEVRDVLTDFVQWLFDDAEVELVRDPRPRSMFKVRVKVSKPSRVSELLARLGPSLSLLN
jgi:hypothetical protein